MSPLPRRPVSRKHCNYCKYPITDTDNPVTATGIFLAGKDPVTGELDYDNYTPTYHDYCLELLEMDEDA